MKRTILAAVALSLAVAATAVARQQVLRNGSFERATDVEGVLIPNYWTSFTNSRQSPLQSQDGAFSAIASSNDGAFVGLYQDSPAAQALEFYRIVMKAQAYIPGYAVFGPQEVAGIKLEFFPPVGIEIPPPVENLAFAVGAPADTWVPVSVTTQVPDGIDIARCVVIMFDDAEDEDEDGDPPGDVPVLNGPIYVDGAFLEASSMPGVNLLSNPSFEVGSSAPNGMCFPPANGPSWCEFADFLTSARKNCLESGMTYIDGNCALKMQGRTTAGVRQDVPVPPGDTITFSAFFRTNSAISPPPWNDPEAVAGVKIEWVAGSVPSPQIDVVPNANPVSGTTNIVNSASPRDQWIPVSIDYTMPDNTAASLRATLINAFGTGGINCDVFFDSYEVVFTNVFNGSDADGDNDEDLLDLAALQRTYTGAGGGMRFGGLVFDHDEDEDVDAPDATYTCERITGPANP
jgi:hypothetical protein